MGRERDKEIERQGETGKERERGRETGRLEGVKSVGLRLGRPRLYVRG